MRFWLWDTIPSTSWSARHNHKFSRMSTHVHFYLLNPSSKQRSLPCTCLPSVTVGVTLTVTVTVTVMLTVTVTLAMTLR